MTTNDHHDEIAARFASLLDRIAAGTITRGTWSDRDSAGRERACLLLALAAEVRSTDEDGDVEYEAARCPAWLLPLWLAELTPWIDDASSNAAWPAMLQRYADVVGRAALVLDAAAWRRWLGRRLGQLGRRLGRLLMRQLGQLGRQLGRLLMRQLGRLLMRRLRLLRRRLRLLRRQLGRLLRRQLGRLLMRRLRRRTESSMRASPRSSARSTKRWDASTRACGYSEPDRCACGFARAVRQAEWAQT